MKKLLLLLLPLNLFSQLSITPDSIAATLAQKLVGTGVTVTNPTLFCNGPAVSEFIYSGTNLDLEHGIMLTSGHAADAAGAVFISSQTAPSIYNNMIDPDLTPLTSGTLNDVCFLAFDFVAPVNNLNAKFIFGSAEYDGFQCSTFNDVFGIFLSGYNPAGSNYTGKNIAVLPNGDIVSISTINVGGGSCTSQNNPAFYFDNSTSADSTLSYYGHTQTIHSSVPLAKDSVYHLKIAIADVGDEAYDSGVLIEDSMFSCQSIPNVTLNSLGFSDTVCVGTASYTLTGGSPAGGTYSGQGVTGNVLNTDSLAAGNYVIQYLYSDSTGCSAAATHSLTVQSCTTDITSLRNKSGLSVYPNPANDHLGVNSDKEIGVITIFNSLGEIALQLKSKNKQEQIDISRLSPGIYTLQTPCGYVKFVKE